MRREDAGQVRGAAGRGDEDFYSARIRFARQFRGQARRAVGRHHVAFVSHAKFFQRLG
jgi:hypothetical protein